MATATIVFEDEADGSVSVKLHAKGKGAETAAHKWAQQAYHSFGIYMSERNKKLEAKKKPMKKVGK